MLGMYKTFMWILQSRNSFWRHPALHYCIH